MGLGGISIWQLLIIMVIILALFGTKKFRNMGGDLGSAIKGFKKAMKEDGTSSDENSDDDNSVIDAKAESVDSVKQKESSNS